MGSRRVWLPRTEPREHTDLREWLQGVALREADPTEMAGYLDGAYPRLMSAIELMPTGPARVLEIGANPYFMTMLMGRLRPDYELELTNFFGGADGSDTGTQTVDDSAGSPHEFSYRRLNVETERFPYEDERFDGVVFCEVLEHLTADPAWALAEIRRVLRPGGWLVLSTPNSARRRNVTRMLRGKTVHDQYSAHGPYGRHNREYTRSELGDLLTAVGFDCDELFTLDGHRAGRASVALARVLGKDSGWNLFALARAARPANASCPAWLYRGTPARPQAS